MKKVVYCALCLLFISFAFSGCNNEQEQGLKVYTSFYTLYDFTAKIAQDKAGVFNIMPSGADAHSWTPGAKDLVNLNKADIFIYNGLGMEHWTEQVVKTLDKKVLKVRVSDGVSEDGLEHDHENTDPHIWLSPQNAKLILKNIKDAFVQVDSDNAEFYEQNYQDYAGLCDEMYSDFIELKDYQRRDIVVTKNAFSHLCRAFDLNQVALSQSHSSEPNPVKIDEIVQYIINNDVKVIFCDSSSLDEAQTLKTEVSRQGRTVEISTLNPLESLSEQDLKNGKDYFKIMRDNLNAIKDALQKQNGIS
jgi:zinc transport system substrate-binding protein